MEFITKLSALRNNPAPYNTDLDLFWLEDAVALMEHRYLDIQVYLLSVDGQVEHEAFIGGEEVEIDGGVPIVNYKARGLQEYADSVMVEAVALAGHRFAIDQLAREACGAEPILALD